MLYLPQIAESEIGGLIDLAKQFGAPVTVMAFFIWRDYKREHDLTVRLRELEEYQKTVLNGIVKDSVEVIAQNNQVFERVIKALEK